MTKVLCADAACKHNANGTCGMKKIRLTYYGVNTLHQGFMEYRSCAEYEESERMAEVRAFMEEKGMGKRE